MLEFRANMVGQLIKYRQIVETRSRSMVNQLILLAASEYHYKMLESRYQFIHLAAMSLQTVGALVRHVFSVYLVSYVQELLE